MCTHACRGERTHTHAHTRTDSFSSSLLVLLLHHLTAHLPEHLAVTSSSCCIFHPGDNVSFQRCRGLELSRHQSLSQVIVPPFFGGGNVSPSVDKVAGETTKETHPKSRVEETEIRHPSHRQPPTPPWRGAMHIWVGIRNKTFMGLF